MAVEPGAFEELVQFQLAEAQPEVRVEFARLLEPVRQQVEDHQPPAGLQDRVRRAIARAGWLAWCSA